MREIPATVTLAELVSWYAWAISSPIGLNIARMEFLDSTKQSVPSLILSRGGTGLGIALGISTRRAGETCGTSETSPQLFPCARETKRVNDVNLMAGLCTHPRAAMGFRLLPRNDVLLHCNVSHHCRPIHRAQSLCTSAGCRC